MFVDAEIEKGVKQKMIRNLTIFLSFFSLFFNQEGLWNIFEDPWYPLTPSSGATASLTLSVKLVHLSFAPYEHLHINFGLIFTLKIDEFIFHLYEPFKNIINALFPLLLCINSIIHKKYIIISTRKSRCQWNKNGYN